MIKKTLYHLTGSDSARRILKEGFKNGEDGLVWLGEHPTQVVGERARARVLKVIINIEPEELHSYGESLKDDEDSNSETGECLPAPENDHQYAGVVYYGMPADRLNAIGHIVLTTHLEGARLKY